MPFHTVVDEFLRALEDLLYRWFGDWVDCKECGAMVPHTYTWGRKNVYQCNCGNKITVKEYG